MRGLVTLSLAVWVVVLVDAMVGGIANYAVMKVHEKGLSLTQ